MPEQRIQSLSAEDKARCAELARKIEAEFPPGVARPRPVDPSMPATLGQYLDLRALVNELRRLRELQGLSVNEVQERTGLDSSVLERIENGEESNPGINTLSRYAGAVGCRISMSLEGRAS